MDRSWEGCSAQGSEESATTEGLIACIGVTGLELHLVQLLYDCGKICI